MLMPLLKHVKVLMAQQAEEGKEKKQAILLTCLKVIFYFIVSPVPLFFLVKIFFLGQMNDDRFPAMTSDIEIFTQ